MSVKKHETSLTNVAESLLTSISEIINSVGCVETEQNFSEIRCYTYRVSLFIMELQTTENPPENANDILKSLSSSIEVMQDLVSKVPRHSNSESESDLNCTILQLEQEIKQMGKCLKAVPQSTFQGEQYLKIAVQALADEMQNANFEFSRTQEKPTEVLEPSKSLSEEELQTGSLPKESDLYSMNVEVSTDSSQLLCKPHLIEMLEAKSLSSQRKHNNGRTSSPQLPHMAEYMEPLYDGFCCPLTKQLMHDPVTIESGVTYEREAISKWFHEFKESQEIFCPASGRKLSSRALKSNLALKTTIGEWIDRNEAARIKVSRAALSLASSSSMVLEAICDLQHICKRRQYNIIEIFHAGMLPSLVKCLQHTDRNVRCATLEFLRQLSESEADVDVKESIAKMMDITAIIKMLSSGHQPTRHGALLLLVEVSSSLSFCKRVGSTPGTILTLVRIKYNQHIDPFASVKAEEILRNLERDVENIKHMAENGLLEPLLNNLVKGSEEIQMEMASYLGEITIGDDRRNYVAETASPALIKMVHTGKSLTRSAAFKALAEFSSHHPSAKILAKVGIIQAMFEEIFTRRIYNEPMNSTNEAAAILANILESGIELENFQATSYGHKLTSEYVLHSIISKIRDSTPNELNISLVRILLCLIRCPTSTGLIVSLIKQTEASYTLIQLINNHHEELAVSAIKMLIGLSPHMGQTLIEMLFKTRGQPENLILGCIETTRITEKQAVSAEFLAKLPHQNLTLNFALRSKNTVARILHIVNEIQRSGRRTSRHAGPYLEGLVGILVRFTTALHEPQMLLLARHHNFTLVFTELLMEKSSNEVQKLSAIGLENLSTESIHLSKPPPPMKKTNIFKHFCLKPFLINESSTKTKTAVCPVHRGACSAQNTFCLIDAQAVERLLTCLEHENAEVIEAALSALCTLLSDNVDVDKSITLMTEMNAIKHVLNVVKEHKREGLLKKTLWIVERFLIKGGDKSVSDVSQDRMFLAALVGTFHHGDGNARQMAENILRYLNKIPNFITSNQT